MNLSVPSQSTYLTINCDDFHKFHSKLQFDPYLPNECSLLALNVEDRSEEKLLDSCDFSDFSELYSNKKGILMRNNIEVQTIISCNAEKKGIQRGNIIENKIILCNTNDININTKKILGGNNAENIKLEKCLKKKRKREEKNKKNYKNSGNSFFPSISSQNNNFLFFENIQQKESRELENPQKTEDEKEEKTFSLMTSQSETEKRFDPNHQLKKTLCKTIEEKEEHLSVISQKQLTKEIKKFLCTKNEDSEDKMDTIKQFSYKSFQNERKNIKIEESRIPSFISLSGIFDKGKICKDNLKILWEGNTKIFQDISELKNLEKSGKITKRISNYLQMKKNNIKDNQLKQRKLDKSEMARKIITKILNSILDATNNYKNPQCIKISKPKKETLCGTVRADFILKFFEQAISSILSNDSNDTNKRSNKEKIQILLNDSTTKNFYEKETLLYKHLNLTVHDCIEIFRYEKEGRNFDFKLTDFLIEEFNAQNKNENQRWLKDYIASLILLTYNIELFFFIRKKNADQKNKEKGKRKK